MEQNLKRLRVGSHDDELGNATVQSLGSCEIKHKRNIDTFVGALSELLVVGSLVHQVQNGDCKLLVGKRVSFGVFFGLRQ